MNQQTSTKTCYKSSAEIEALVREFESCTIELERFKHPAHLTVALWYLSRLPAEEATERIRSGLLSLLKHHGLQGYNETITLFWLKVVQHFLVNTDTKRPLADLANNLIQTHNNSRLIFHYYSHDLLSSEQAKASWVEPDLKPLDL